MKKFITKATALLSLFAVVACSEEALVENTPTNDGTIREISITGKDFQLDGETRSSVTISESGASFTWNEDDVIGIFPNEGDQVSFAMDNGVGTQTATFSGGGWALKSSATYAAYYPHVYENRDMTKIPVSYVGQTQNGNNNTDHIGAYDFMAAGVSTPSNGKVAFDMQHLGCLVQLKITIPEPSELIRVDLKSNAEFTLTGAVDLSAGTPAINAADQSESLSINLTNIATTEANEKVTIYFMMAPMDLSSSNITATVCSKDETICETEIIGKKLEAGKIYAFEEVDRRLLSILTAAVEPTQDENGCYLLKSASNFKWFIDNSSNYSTKNFKLDTDIIFDDTYRYNKNISYFKGTFDGGNHKIEDYTPKFSGYGTALFGTVYGTIKNIVMANSDVDVSSDDGYKNTCGAALIGNAENGAVIINCGVINSSISVASTSAAETAGGGLIGRVSGNNVCVKGCYVVGTQIVGKNYWNNGTNVGGLIGQLGEGTTSITGLNITSCYTKDIDISADNKCYIGTFIGSAHYLDTYSTSSTITTCYYDASGTYTAIGKANEIYNFTTSIFDALSDNNLANAITNMNLNLTDCDYIFGADGSFVKRQ